MSPLEARYRRTLVVLPRAYRAARAEEMVDTFLLSMHEEDPEDDAIVHLTGRPSVAEQLSVVRLALRLRWGGSRAPMRYQVHGGAVRWCVTAIVGIQAVSAALSMVVGLWIAGALPVGPPAGAFMQHGLSWAWARAAAGALWIPTFIAIVHGQRRGAQVLAMLATAPLPVIVLRETSLYLADSPDQVPGLLSTWVALGIDVAVVLGMFAFHQDAPAPKARPWLIAGALAVVTVSASAFLVFPGPAAWFLIDDISLWCLAAVLGAVALPIAAQGWSSTRRTQAQLGLAMLCAAASMLRAATIIETVAHGGWGTVPTYVHVGLVIQVALVATLGAAFALVAFRELRQMPRVTYASS